MAPQTRWTYKAKSTFTGHRDDFKIDIVAETLEGDVEAYEVKRNPQNYSSARLDEKVTEMKRGLFRGKEVSKKGLSMEDM